ncbi:MAG: Lrp/AsnC family transcriptional regulator [bacterium]
MDQLDRDIINQLQKSFPVCDRPFEQAASELKTTESELMTRISFMLEDGLLTRFGPLYHAERLGGALSLCAMEVPEQQFDSVAEQVNSFTEVAHNYQREHAYNMWFVLATESEQALQEVLSNIEKRTGLKVHSLPKIEEFYVGLYFQV